MNDLIVSIGIVALNEENYVDNLLCDILKQTYDLKKIELVLVDSCSKDNTKKKFIEFQQTKKDLFYNIIVLDNPNIKQASGWNIVISNFTGDVLSRIDAHSKLTDNFISAVVEEFKKGEKVVGGPRPCIIENKGAWTHMLVSVENSLFGSSINKSRHSMQKSYVKTMFHATYAREVFDNVGKFNESLGRTEDNEMHYRIRKAGYRLCFNPIILSYQYARVSFRKMIKQKYLNGLWIGRTLKICPQCLSLYHFIPFGFLMGIIFTSILLIWKFWYLSACLWGMYIIFSLFSSISISFKNKLKFGFLIMPFMYLILHLSYGFGTFIGLFYLKKANKRRYTYEYKG